MNNYLLLDGGTGTPLMAAGMPQGVCVESWVLQNPAVLQNLQRQYLAAGSRVLLTPTFGANRARLKQFGLQDKVAEMNRALAALTAEVAGHTAIVAGDVSPTGLFCRPWGDIAFEELVDIYAQQITALKEGGAQLIFAETMMSLGDVRAAVVAARDCGLPAVASVTVDAAGRTLSGMPCESAVIALQAAGAVAVGLNCSTGPQDMAALLPRLAKYARVPLLVKPNAGTPDAPLDPVAFANAAAALAENGVLLLGGCCQSTPDHIAALSDALAARGLAPLDAAHWLKTITHSATSAQKTTARMDGLPLCFENRVFPDAPDAALQLSEPIPCNEDLADSVCDVENDDADAILVQLCEGDDPACLADVPMGATLPLVLQAANEQLLADALRGFCGRVGVVCKDTAQSMVARYWGAREI